MTDAMSQPNRYKVTKMKEVGDGLYELEFFRENEEPQSFGSIMLSAAMPKDVIESFQAGEDVYLAYESPEPKRAGLNGRY